MTQQIRGTIVKIISMQVNGTSTYLFTLHPVHQPDNTKIYKAVFVEPSKVKLKKSSGSWEPKLPPGASVGLPVTDSDDTHALPIDVLKLKLGFLSVGTLVTVTLEEKDAEGLSLGYAPDFSRQITIVDINDVDIDDNE